MLKWAIFKPISKAILKEFFATLLILFIIAFSVFILVYHSPNEDMLTEYMIMITEEMGSGDNVDLENISFTSSFTLWLSAVLTGNFGLSLSNGMPAFEQSLEFLGNSTFLIFYSIVLSLFISLPFTYLIVNKNYNVLQKTTSFTLVTSSFFPLFWLAYLAIYLSGHYFNYFPLSENNVEGSTNYFLPIVLLSIGSGLIIEIAHQLGHEINRVLKEDYMVCVKAKGASTFKHLFKEGIAFPLLTIISNRIAYLFGATIIIEQIFNWPGIGRLLWQATQNRDIPLLLSAIVITVLTIRFAQFLARVCYILINPRASHE